MACSSHAEIPSHRALTTVLTAVVLALPLSRLVYWYGRPDSYPSLLLALTSGNTESFALAGAMAGCVLSVFVTGKPGERGKILDCMSVGGCAGLALGRLGCFFTETNRGQIMTRLTALPWAYPVANASGQPEYRFATFLFQAAFAMVLGIFLAWVFFHKRRRHGDVALLFLLCYSASQVILDSTRYDSLYLRSNGFVSMVQVLAAITLVAVLVLLSLRTVSVLGWKTWMLPLWLMLAAFFAGAGYMEYYVQRHGREAAFAYSVMGTCLAFLVVLGLVFWHKSKPPVTEP